MPGRWSARSTMNCTRLPDVQARRGRVEAAVVGDRPLGEGGAQRVLVGGLGDQPAPVQLVEHVVAHRSAILPGASCRRGLPPAPEHAHRRRVGRPRTATAGRSPRRCPTRGPADTDGRRRAPVQPHRAGAGRGRSAPLSSGPIAERLGQPGRAAGEVPGHPRGRTAASAPASSPIDDLAGPQQHRRAAALGTDDDVGAPVHAVGEVDVEPAGRPEHDLGARRRPAVGVRRRVLPLAPSTPRPRSAAPRPRPAGRSVTTQQPSSDGATTSTGPSRSSARTRGPGSGRSGSGRALRARPPPARTTPSRRAPAASAFSAASCSATRSGAVPPRAERAAQRARHRQHRPDVGGEPLVDPRPARRRPARRARAPASSQ